VQDSTIAAAQKGASTSGRFFVPRHTTRAVERVLAETETEADGDQGGDEP